jgi:hypothetical protein
VRPGVIASDAHQTWPSATRVHAPRQAWSDQSSAPPEHKGNIHRAESNFRPTLRA